VINFSQINERFSNFFLFLYKIRLFMESAVSAILQKYPSGRKDLLIPVLQEIQRTAGHLTNDTLIKVSSHLNIPINSIYGVATFYDQFRFTDKGRYHIRICRGTACHVYCSSNYLAELEKHLNVRAGNTSKDGKFSIELVNCLGACSNAPAIAVNDTYYTGVTPSLLTTLISSLKEKAE
jgi:NADH-quinone oxidoreductase subunit E